jgi:hypothetical protein
MHRTFLFVREFGTVFVLSVKRSARTYACTITWQQEPAEPWASEWQRAAQRQNLPWT